MKKTLKFVLRLLDDNILRFIVKFLYPQYKRQRVGYMYNYKLLIKYGIVQKLFRINGSVPWPVDFRSRIIGWEFINKGVMCDPGDNLGIYINANGGIVLGDNVAIGANCVIVASNHSMYDHSKHSQRKMGISIGNNVWVGANSVILPGVVIGNNVTIGAGSVINKNIPSESIVLSESRTLTVVPKKRHYEWDYNNIEFI